MAGRRGLSALAFQFLSAGAAHALGARLLHCFTKRLDKLADYISNPNICTDQLF
jgi:hypothetical protein